ncbi:nucleolar protein 8 isoform X2 [Ornithorhynchus anatinus]|uniref:nucleolar protein 8 isoform X2 n=1 Tax=Ornithorhynchus anatinus TaxID=9258 RepID=UPI0010A76545|nr:nucleolar protein 8 isoform X2 [Ornithorhynchus anatinus]
METEKATKRLYVGGLSQTISQADLQHQFSRFGDVSDVEMITRKDDQGNPTKTFAYVNIKTTDLEFKRCMSLLNKTKWKGGTLQIELAKESFLHRLAQERQEAKVKKEKPLRVQHADRLESLRKAGVVDFHMKAVPGTEIPDNKDWVVSKFGRVLPVLHLRSQTRRKIIKYDPSNYCHNLKRLEQAFTDTVPIGSLTWQLEGGDDPMSKKRRGEFPVFHNRYQKKARIRGNKDINGVPAQGPDLLVTNQNLIREKSIQKTHFTSNGLPKLLQIPNNNKSEERFLQTSAPEPVEKVNSMSDEDFDSEEEFRAAVAREKTLRRGTPDAEPEDDPLEIVSEHFELKLSTHWSLTNSDIKKNAFCGGKGEGDDDDNSDCDSADTDEIIATKKPPSKSRDSQDYSKSKSKPGPEERIVSKEMPKPKASGSLSVGKVKSPHFKGQSDNTESQSDSTGSESDSDTSDSDGDMDYEAMMRNCYHLDLTLEDLEKLAGGDLESSGEGTQSKPSGTTKRGVKVDGERNGRASTPVRKPTRCINPEDIVASILEGEEDVSDDRVPKRSTAESKFQAFKGIGSLYRDKTLEKHQRETAASSERKKELTSASPAPSGTVVPEEDGSSSPDLSWDGETADGRPQVVTEARSVKGTRVGPGKLQKRKTSSASKAPSLESADSRSPPFGGIKSTSARPGTPGTGLRDEDDGSHNQPGLPGSEEDSSAARPSVTPSVQQSQKVTIPKTPVKKLVKDSIEKGSTASAVLSHGTKAEPLKSTADFILPVNTVHGAEAKDQHLQDNQKRLAAIQERQREREMQKKLIRGALSSLDGQVESKSTHIIFNSDGESEAEEKLSNEECEWTKEKKREFKSRTSGKLFESSEDEGDESEDDGDRFKIKPQFEGKAGQKLMNLQSRFGTDDRFRMDSKFLESDSEAEDAEVKKETTAEEEELAEEKKKNLDVLQSILHIDLQTPKLSKQASAAREFKDMNSMRYDPTRPDHVAFEKKVNGASKESKAKRKKNRIEAEKLPEVSKEIYYDVAVDLKDLFGSTKCSVEQPEKIPWDRSEVEDSIEADPKPLAQNNVEEESAGFTFSFFGPDTEEVKESKEESYKVEMIKPGKVVWQEDPRFQDSSSEEEEQEEEEEQQLEEVDGGRPSLGLPSLPERQTVRFFFFSRDDERLREGCELFWRKSVHQESRDAWEARSSALLVECRKKHKDARRKVKGKH